jgi:dolichol-phosphate mannosyltransferase/undecaprenyl-phosphate 4-deoxy-4-formamido-L-arabinose transferase
MGSLPQRFNFILLIRTLPMIEYSVVIPVYAGSATLVELCARLDQTLSHLGHDYEIILIDDFSPDYSWDVMQYIHEHNSRVKLIRLQKNVGQHAAVLCGLTHSVGNYIVTMDDDLQHPPEEIPNLLRALRCNDQIDAVIGIPLEKQHHLLRRCGSELLNFFITHIFKKDRQLRMSSFRILRRTLVLSLLSLQVPNPTIGSMLLLVSTRIQNLPIEHQPRSSGRSGYNLLKLLRLMYNNILNYSALPLQIVSYVGVLCVALSLILLLYFLWQAPSVMVSGWSTLVVLITFFSGFILFSLGLIGEYLVRIIKVINHYPIYLIAKTKGFSKEVF